MYRYAAAPWKLHSRSGLPLQSLSLPPLPRCCLHPHAPSSLTWTSSNLLTSSTACYPQYYAPWPVRLRLTTFLQLPLYLISPWPPRYGWASPPPEPCWSHFPCVLCALSFSGLLSHLTILPSRVLVSAWKALSSTHLPLPLHPSDSSLIILGPPWRVRFPHIAPTPFLHSTHYRVCTCTITNIPPPWQDCTGAIATQMQILTDFAYHLFPSSQHFAWYVYFCWTNEWMNPKFRTTVPGFNNKTIPRVFRGGRGENCFSMKEGKIRLTSRFFL